jgi:hypothetical protein
MKSTKTLFASALLLLAPVAAHGCAATDFAIEGFKMKPSAGGRLSLAGQLVNHCSAAAAAQVRIEAKNASGSVVQARQGWPAGTSNIDPGKSADFDMGRMFRADPDVQTYSVSVVDVRTW